MKRKIFALLLTILALMISVIVVILPTFHTNGLSRIELEQDLGLELLLDGKHDIELVFFGYAGCLNVCTPRLEKIGIWYGTLPDQNRNRLGLRFYDLSVPEDKTLPDVFAKAFHPSFKGIHLDEKTLRVYTKAFSVYFARSLSDKTEMDHTTHLYLTKRDNNGKRLRYIYTAYPYDFQQIQSDIKVLLNE